MSKQNILFGIVFILMIVVISLNLNIGSEFGGADGLASEYIEASDPEFKPVMESFWSPPGGETESLLFALQAAFGSAIVFYVLGYYKGKKEASKC